MMEHKYIKIIAIYKLKFYNKKQKRQAVTVALIMHTNPKHPSEGILARECHPHQ